MATIQPYPAGTLWNYRNLQDPTVTRTEEIVLSWEPSACWITDDYTPDEITADKLWSRWVDKVAAVLHDENPGRYESGDVEIDWNVYPAFEFLPHARRTAPEGHKVETFLTFFSHPLHAVTGERLNWARLPVRDKGWNADRADKGGFIQELLGWKPSPYQDVMNVHQLARAAGLA